MFIMGKTRREFTSEYKDEAVKLVINTGRSGATVARKLGVSEASLGRWVYSFTTRQHDHPQRRRHSSSLLSCCGAHSVSTAEKSPLFAGDSGMLADRESACSPLARGYGPVASPEHLSFPRFDLSTICPVKV